MKLEEREVADLHEIALCEWEHRPRVCWLLHRAYGLYVWLLAWVIRLRVRGVLR